MRKDHIFSDRLSLGSTPHAKSDVAPVHLNLFPESELFAPRLHPKPETRAQHVRLLAKP